jgi:hypothetical protein
MAGSDTHTPLVGALVNLIARALGALVVADDRNPRARRQRGGGEDVHVRVSTSVAIVTHVVRVYISGSDAEVTRQVPLSVRCRRVLVEYVDGGGDARREGEAREMGGNWERRGAMTAGDRAR